METAIQGVIFDLDGTLGDTLPVCFAAFRRVFQQRLRWTLTDAEILARFGPSEEGVLAGLLPEADVESAYQDFLAAYRWEHRRCPRPFDGVVELVDELIDAGLKLAVVTGKGPLSAHISLDAFGLRGAFDPVEAGSPHGAVKPEAMRRVLDAWNLSPDAVVSIGDAPSDVRSAHAVGLTSVAAAWAASTKREALRRAGPDVWFDDVAELSGWLLARVRGGVESRE